MSAMTTTAAVPPTSYGLDTPSRTLRKLFSYNRVGSPRDKLGSGGFDQEYSGGYFNTSADVADDDFSDRPVSSPIQGSPRKVFRNVFPRRSFCDDASTGSSSPLSTTSRTTSNSAGSVVVLSNVAHKLDIVLSLPETRNDLVDQLLATQGLDDVLKVRFLCAINESLRTTDRKERAAKAAKVVDIFIKESSKFHIQAIPTQYRNDLLNSRFEVVIPVKNLIAAELAKNEAIAALFAKHDLASFPMI
jgi:hypothetical protein